MKRNSLRVPLLKIVAAITQNRKLSLRIIRRGDDPPGATDVASARVLTDLLESYLVNENLEVELVLFVSGAGQKGLK